MSDPSPPAPVAPVRGWTVRILDLSGGAEDGVTEIVRGFADAETAGVFARAYVRDSFEHCRQPGASAREVLDAWFAYGEDAALAAPGEELAEGDETEGGEGWRGGDELEWFAAHAASEEERDWRSLDPRREDEEPEEA